MEDPPALPDGDQQRRGWRPHLESRPLPAGYPTRQARQKRGGCLVSGDGSLSWPLPAPPACRPSQAGERREVPPGPPSRPRSVVPPPPQARPVQHSCSTIVSVGATAPATDAPATAVPATAARHRRPPPPTRAAGAAAATRGQEASSNGEHATPPTRSGQSGRNAGAPCSRRQRSAWQGGRHPHPPSTGVPPTLQGAHGGGRRRPLRRAKLFHSR